MNTSRRKFISSTAAATLAISSTAGQSASTAAPPPPFGTSKIKSISAMTLAPDGKLVIADWRSGALHALTLPALKDAVETSFNALNLSDQLAKAYALEASSIRVTAAAMHGKAQVAILAVTLGRTADARPAIALVDARGKITKLDIETALSASQPLSQLPSDGQLWSRQSARTLMVTDIKSFGNELIVAGLTNSTFSSTLRRVPYPFSGTGIAASVDMYHAVHNQIETRAPVRAFNVIDVGGEPTLLAAYTCTPLVTVPLAALKDGAKVRGKTIAELGFGNTPLDVIPFAIEYQGKKSDWVIVANSAKAADLISLADITKAAQSEGLSKPVKAPFEQHAGVRSIPIPITGVQRVMDQGPQFLAALRREAEGGQLQIVSIRKGAFFRLSDFVNEYDFPNYSYPGDDKFQQEYIRPFHKMMKGDEGHANLAK